MAACVLAGLLVAAVSCGGGGGGSVKSAYLRKVNQLCREAAAERRTLVPASSATPTQLAGALRQAVAVDEQLQQRISALKPPPGDAETIRRLLELSSQEQHVVLQLVVAIQRRDVQGTKILSDQLDRLGTESQRIANRYGLTSCTQKA